MKKIFFVFCILLYIESNAQFHSVDFSFDVNAQSLQYNPGANYPYLKLKSFPLLTNTNFFVGNSGFKAAELFSPKGDFTNKLYKVTNKLSNDDFILLNYRQDLFSYGWLDDLGRFKYFGLYWELDHFTNFPADLIRLARDGNHTNLYEQYDFKYLATKTDFIQTIYYGINYKTNFFLNFGFRVKLYSGLANMESVGNRGKFYTTDGQNNYYIHHLDKVQLQINSSTIPNPESFNPENSDMDNYKNIALGKILFSKNFGPGLDVGFSYHKSGQLYFSGAILDLGFIYYTSDIRSAKLKGNYKYEGAQLSTSEGNYYWQNTIDNFKKNVNFEESDHSYISFRPTSIYLGIRYGLTDLINQECENFLHLKTEHSSFLGITAFAQYRPVKLYKAITGFYEKKWSKFLYTKFNVTIDNFNKASLGAGVALNLKYFQIYMSADNLLGLTDLSSSKKQSVNLGLNFINF